ncbi:protein disulfide-isomerase A1 [Pancytospora epiphaga]|nr:protein disulfide-isomerase A1 [Pancytospora epiphaga]
MFFYIAAVAARSIVLKALSQEDVAKVADIHSAYDGEVTVEIDPKLEKNSFTVTTGDFNIQAKGKEELKSIIGITEKLEDAPAELPEIFEALKARNADPIEELKTGAVSFTVLFTKDPSHIKNLKGIETTRDMKYFLSSDEEMTRKLNVPFPSVYSYNAVDKVVLSLPFFEEYSSLRAAYSVPPFTRITPSIVKTLQDLAQPVVYVISKRGDYRKIKDEMNHLMKKYASEVKFIFFSPEEISSLITLIGTKDSDYPLLLTMNKEEKLMVRNVNFSNFDESYKKISSKTAEIIKFSAIIPEDNDVRPLKVLNTATVETFMKNQNNDRIIAFTSPHCGYCNQLKPILNQVASMFMANNVDITVAEYNVIANENFRHAEITGVPTLFYLKKGSSELNKLPTEARTLKTIVEYVSKEGVSAVVDPKDYADAPEAVENDNEEPEISEDIDDDSGIELTDEVEEEIATAAEEAKKHDSPHKTEGREVL